MRGLLAILVAFVGFYGVGFLSVAEATESLTKQLEDKSFAEANMLLSANFEAKQ